MKIMKISVPKIESFFRVSANIFPIHLNDYWSYNIEEVTSQEITKSLSKSCVVSIVNPLFHNIENFSTLWNKGLIAVNG